MKIKRFILLPLLFTIHLANGQSYAAYFTGNPVDTLTQPDGGVCLMGGSRENDEAMKWFLRRANGGDVLVLRASGSDGYNDYLYTDLGVPVNSVETIVFRDSSASFDPYVHQKIRNAEAVWFAGGDQWNYVSYWRGTPVDSLINEGIRERKIVVGGTSAGMAILGGFYFSAQVNTVASEQALADPYDERVTVDSARFLQTPYLSDVVTDTHYAQRNRQGRHVAFLARALVDYGVQAKGIACNERTAVCIDPQGLARVYGDYPAHETIAYFIQPNCELSDGQPERCEPGAPLDWNRDGRALKVYAVKGTMEGGGTFDLKDWRTGTGGEWRHWLVKGGAWFSTTGSAIRCD